MTTMIINDVEVNQPPTRAVNALSDADVEGILRAVMDGETNAKIAERFDCSTSRVTELIRDGGRKSCKPDWFVKPENRGNRSKALTPEQDAEIAVKLWQAYDNEDDRPTRKQLGEEYGVTPATIGTAAHRAMKRAAAAAENDK